MVYAGNNPEEEDNSEDGSESGFTGLETMDNSVVRTSLFNWSAPNDIAKLNRGREEERHRARFDLCDSNVNAHLDIQLPAIGVAGCDIQRPAIGVAARSSFAFFRSLCFRSSSDVDVGRLRSCVYLPPQPVPSIWRQNLAVLGLGRAPRLINTVVTTILQRNRFLVTETVDDIESRQGNFADILESVRSLSPDRVFREAVGYSLLSQATSI